MEPPQPNPNPTIEPLQTPSENPNNPSSDNSDDTLLDSTTPLDLPPQPPKKRRRRKKQFPEMISTAAVRIIRHKSGNHSPPHDPTTNFSTHRRRRISSDLDIETLIAISVGFPPDSLTEEEVEANVVKKIGDAEQANYVVIRNHILARWRLNVDVWLTKEHALKTIGWIDGIDVINWVLCSCGVLNRVCVDLITTWWCHCLLLILELDCGGLWWGYDFPVDFWSVMMIFVDSCGGIVMVWLIS